MQTIATEPLDLQPALTGRTLFLRPMMREDFEAVFAAASDPLIWEQHPCPGRCQRSEFEPWFEESLASGGALVIVDKASGSIIGSSRYYSPDAEKREVAIGHTFLMRQHWGGAVNAELKELMLSHAFQWADRVWFHIAACNIRSQKAMAKIGGILSHNALHEINGNLVDYLFFYLNAGTYRRTSQRTDPHPS